jgi:hypothetical protein
MFKQYCPRSECFCLKNTTQLVYFFPCFRPDRTSFKFEYLREFEAFFENILDYKPVTDMGSTYEKNPQENLMQLYLQAVAKAFLPDVPLGLHLAGVEHAEVGVEPLVRREAAWFSATLLFTQVITV